MRCITAICPAKLPKLSRATHANVLRKSRNGNRCTTRSIRQSLAELDRSDVDRPDAHVDGLRVTMVGHATLRIQIAGHNLLTGPVWSDRASPLAFAGLRRVTAPGVRIEDLRRSMRSCYPA